MDRNFQRSLSLVLKSEGGFVNDPRDPGGATNKGVTLSTFRAYVDPKGTVDSLKKITDAQVSTVYRRQYWDAVHGAELPDGVDYAVFDFAVNSAPDRAKKYLQAVVGVAQDGRIGPETLAAVKAKFPAAVINPLCDKRLAFLKGLKTWPTFGKGWERRVASVRSEALNMSTGPVPTQIPAPTPTETPPAQQEATPQGNWISLIIKALAAIFTRK